MKEMFIVVGAIVACMVIGYAVAALLGASQAQREWAMLLCIVALGVAAGLRCLIRLEKISKALNEKIKE